MFHRLGHGDVTRVTGGLGYNPKMPRRSCVLRTLIAAAVAVVAFAGGALALPAPMSKSDLLLKSDLVALVRIWSVTCDSVSKDPQTGEALPDWSANAQLIEVIKGNEAKGDTVTLYFHAVPSGAPDQWSVRYYPGEMVWTHLIRQDDGYTTVWWNGRGNVVNKAIITELPTTPGKTAALHRRRRQYIDQ
jgi:hypothetical protein